MARQKQQRGRQTLSGQKLWTLTWAVRNVLTRGVRKPWKQLIDVHENSGSKRKKKTFQGAVSGNRCKIIILKN